MTLIETNPDIPGGTETFFGSMLERDAMNTS